ncbi:MAG: thioredoxin-disulfide reductase, partial [Agrobacterium sp.]|nr:thioredoxin-disulfide reductase [Agrobacterium sp.]
VAFTFSCVLLELHSEVDEILGDHTGVTGIRLRHRDGSLKEIATQGVFIAIGHKPNTDIFDGQLEMVNGYIKGS